jgi:ketosteroid isomerase-like protein
MHCAIIGNLQEKFKVSPTTSAGGKPDHSLAGDARSDSLIQQAHGERQKLTAGANPSKGERHMKIRSNIWTRAAKNFTAGLTLMLVFAMITSAVAGPEDEVRATFDRFVVAQNAHDIKAVETLLLGSPDFLWITRGTPIWGPDAAIKRFAALYEGTWRLDPEPSSLKITMIGEGVAQIFVPIVFTIGPPGQPPQQMKFLMNQVLVKTPSGWRVSSILPMPAPAQ